MTWLALMLLAVTVFVWSVAYAEEHPDGTAHRVLTAGLEVDR